MGFGQVTHVPKKGAPDCFHERRPQVTIQISDQCQLDPMVILVLIIAKLG